MLDRERIIRCLQWLLLLALFAYDGFTYLPEESNFALLKSAYYVLIFIGYILIVTLQTRQGHIPFRRPGRISYVIQAYIWLYFMRLFYDFMIVGVQQEIVTNPFAAVFLYANAAIVPFYAMYFFRWDLIDLRKLNTTILLIFLIMGSVSMYYIFSGRALEYLGSDGRFMGNESMDTIAFGHLGTSLTLLAITLFHQSGIRLWHKVLSIGSILVGLFITVAAGSRGAIVALLVCGLMYMYLRGHRKWLFIGIPVLMLVVYLTLPILNDVLISYNNHSMERLYNSLYDSSSMQGGVTSNRDILYTQGWHNFTESPVIGYSFFIKGEYAHNCIIESFMGLGIIGGVLFLWMIVYALRAAAQLALRDKRFLFVSLLFIQYVCYSLFSRTLSMLPLFWITLYLVIYFRAANE